VTWRSRSPAPDDTIVAIATPPGAGALGVIRISGSRAVPLASALVRLAREIDLAAASPRTLHRAAVIDPRTGETLDEMLVVAMRGPRSYTGEDVVELSCHGNPVLLGEIVRQLVVRGARLAEPGEFTRRAYLNGRLDLLQAEAVAELIGARSERAVRLAARQLRGPLAAEVASVRERLLDLVAGLEVALDFPEDEIGVSRKEAVVQAGEMAGGLQRLVVGVRHGRALQDGLAVMLTGAPNVGKSSVMNALLGVERAIVSPSPGTTRDLIEGTLVIRGVALRLTDGAGLGSPADAIDAEGMRRARHAVGESDLVIVVLDRSRPISPGDREIMRLTAERERLVIGNKSDLPPARQDDALCEIACSALTGAGIERLKERLGEWVEKRTAGDADEGGVVASLRVLERLEQTCMLLASAARGLEDVAIEAVLVDLREALTALGQILGTDADDALLDRIFATFCVGK
jgi:tRNA modification GTPase